MDAWDNSLPPPAFDSWSHVVAAAEIVSRLEIAWEGKTTFLRFFRAAPQKSRFSFPGDPFS
jgi:hypothetical protein